MPSHQVVIKPDIAQWTVQALIRLFATFAVIQGAGIIVGGAERWASENYAVALMVPYAPESWGIVLVALGLATLLASLTASRRALVVTLYLTGLWFLAFAFSRFAALGNPGVSLDAALASLRPFATCVVLAVAHRTQR